MKKKFLAVILSVLIAGSIAGCGKQDTEDPTQDTGGSTEEGSSQTDETGELIYLSDFHPGDYVTLGAYKEIELSAPEITDEDVDAYIEYMLSSYAESVPVTDRSVETGDIVNIDFEGKMDGEAFEGGTSRGYDLVIGAGGFIAGFEDGIVGMEIGETKDLDLSFPDPYYNNPDLSGKGVVFTITLNSISEQVPPDLTDEFVAELGIEDCATVEAYRKYVHDGLTEQEQASLEANKANAAVLVIEENTSFQPVPQGMLNRINDAMKSNAAAMYGGTADAFGDSFLEQANLMAQRYIMLAAIAEEEGISVTDEELDEGLAREAESYGFESTQEYKDAIDAESYREYLLIQKVLDYLEENAVISGSSLE